MTLTELGLDPRSALLDCQRRILERIASGAPLSEGLGTLVRLIEEQAPDMRCAVLLADADGQALSFVAAPNIPEDYKEGIKRFLRIAPKMGSCGTAAYLREPVYTEDTATDPRWEGCRHFAVRNGLRAIWSTPILGDDNAVLGTFAMYYGEPRLPEPEHIQLIDMAVQMARVAIQSKQDEERLRASEQKYRLIAEHARDLIALIDPTGRRLYTSPSYRALYGGEAGRLEGQIAFDTVLPEDRARVEQEFKAMVASGVGRRFEFRVMTSGKGVRHLQIESSPILDSAGRTTAVLGVGRDVTEERRTQQVLQERTGLLRTIFESASAGIVITDMEHKLLRVNPAFCRITGYPESELEGRTAWFLSHEEDREKCEAAFRELANGTDPVEVDKRYRRKDGSVVWVHVTATLVRDGSGEPRYTVAMVEDITQRREAQLALEDSARELRLVIDTIPAMAWTVLPDGKLEFFNHRWLDYAGVSMQEAIAHPTGAVHPEDLPRVIERWRGALASGEPCEDEMRLRRADGEYRKFLVRTIPLRDDNGRIIKWYGTSTDIEDSRRAQEALRKSERLLCEAEQLGHTGSWEHNLLTGGIFNTSENIRLFFGDDRTKGARFEDYVDAMHPDDRARVMERHAQLLAEGGPSDIEFRVVWPDGDVHVLHGLATVVRDESGQAVRVYGTNIDITERKRAEDAVRDSQQLLHLVLATLPVGVVVTNRGGDITLVNAASKRIWGGDPIVSGRERWARCKGSWHDSGKRISPGDWASVRALSEGQTSLNELIDIETFDDERKTIQNSSVPIRNTEGQIVGAVIVNEDVTERVRAEEALRESATHLQHLSRRLLAVQEEERRRLSRELHDRLGETLTALSINLSMLKEGVRGDTRTTARVEDSAALVKSTAVTIENIVAELRPPMLDDHGLAAALDWYGRQFAARAGIAVIVQADEPSARVAPGVGIALFRIAQEALNNVAKHAQARRVVITLRRAQSEFVMTIADDGVGLPAAATSSQRRGTGLGMATMRERAQAVGGSFEVERPAERGTRLTVKVPL
jgi:PAS domain S-box-containing protein